MTARKVRGAATQRDVANHFQANGFPYAQAVGAGAQGRDILNMLGLAPEVKARKDFNPTGWVRQAAANAGGDLPFVVLRPNGLGPASIELWPVILRLGDFTTLIRDAGYGQEPK